MTLILPETLTGHWETSDGNMVATSFAPLLRKDLSMGKVSDYELANAIYLASRSDMALIGYQQAAKERIRWLSVQLAVERMKS